MRSSGTIHCCSSGSCRHGFVCSSAGPSTVLPLRTASGAGSGSSSPIPRFTIVSTCWQPDFDVVSHVPNLADCITWLRALRGGILRRSVAVQSQGLTEAR